MQPKKKISTNLCIPDTFVNIKCNRSQIKLRHDKIFNDREIDVIVKTSKERVIQLSRTANLHNNSADRIDLKRIELSESDNRERKVSEKMKKLKNHIQSEECRQQYFATSLRTINKYANSNFIDLT